MISLLLIPLFIYLGFLIFAYFYADKIIFQPPTSSYRDDDRIIKLKTSDGETISARFYANPEAVQTILLSHGNAEDIGLPDALSEELVKNGFAVLIYDYRGYGTSEGKPSEENVYRDIDAAYDYLLEALKIPSQRIILHGRSLGAAAAVDLAARKRVGGLIVESGFVSAFRVLTKIPLSPFDKFRNLSKIQEVECPVLFIHGRQDEVIAFWHAEALFAAADEPKFSFWLENASHNNVYRTGGEAYLQAIQDFADRLPK